MAVVIRPSREMMVVGTACSLASRTYMYPYPEHQSSESVCSHHYHGTGRSSYPGDSKQC
jgi:hypothetical protein